MRFKFRYFLITVLLFAIELLIALFVHDKIVRPYIGDMLVVILIYALLKTFLNIPVLVAAGIALSFSYFVECLQYFNIVGRLGLEKSRVARIVIGTSFSWTDILMYTAGILVVLFFERITASRQ